RRFSTRIMRHILRSSLVLLLAACSTQPPYERPQVELPAAWKEAAPRLAEDGRWWRIYRDQELDKVIDEAFAGNADLVIAAAREAVRLALAAQVAKSYFALRALDEQVELTRRTVLLREEALGLQRKRRDAGVISEFDLRQLEAETAAVRAQLPPLQREREREEAALSVLLGRTPKQVFESGITVRLSFDEQPEAAVVPSGLPSELLLRRPDLVQAERGLAAANGRRARARATAPKARAPRRWARRCASHACATRTASPASSTSSTRSAGCSPPASRASRRCARTARRSRTCSGPLAVSGRRRNPSPARRPRCRRRSARDFPGGRSRPARKTAAGNAPPWDARARRGARASGSPPE